MRGFDMAKIYLQMEFDSKEEMLAMLGTEQPAAQAQRHFGIGVSNETKKKISEGTKAMYAKKRAKPKQSEPAPIGAAILSDKEENIAIANVGKHYTNSATKSSLIRNLIMLDLTEELAEKALIRMVRMGKLIQITPNTFRRPTSMLGKPKKKRGEATIGEYAKGD